MSRANRRRLIALEELQQELEESQRELFKERFGGFSSETLWWSALAPVWTVQLAERAGFPANPKTTFAHFENHGLLQREGETVRLQSSAREEIFPPTFFESKGNIDAIRSVLARIGTSLRAVSDSERVPPLLRRWADLSQYGERPLDLATHFREQVQEALETNNLVDLRGWIEAARPLASVLSRMGLSALQLAIELAYRSLELHARWERDHRFLQNYLARPEQENALWKFMPGATKPSPRTPLPWMLHFIGAGGTGKTMLMRYLARELLHRDAITARIDFDYLEPDYPTLAPGLLLQAFAQELRLHDLTSRAETLFDQTDETLNNLHTRLRQSTSSREEFAVAHDSDFHHALNVYIDALDNLASEGKAPGSPRPIVLILDTCEELAKFQHASPTSRSNLRATFRILKSLYSGPVALTSEHPDKLPPRLPNLRVLFSGRLLLAASGANFTATDETVREHLEPQSCLELHEIRGFTRPEASEFLLDKIGVGNNYVSVLLEKCPDLGSVVPVDWHSPEVGDENTNRYSPFELNLYANWVKEDSPTIEEVEKRGTDRYLEVRILQRLGDRSTLVEFLPILAKIGHFDEEVLGVATGTEGEDLQSLTDQVGQPEWIVSRYVQNDESSGPKRTWDIEPRMGDRLRTYYQARHTPLPTRDRVADHLEHRTTTVKLEFLDWTLLDATFRVLETEPTRAARWWYQFEERITRERPWDWIQKLIEPLLSSDGALKLHFSTQTNETSASPLRLLALTTLADASLATNDLRQVTYWLELTEKAATFPDEVTRDNLLCRAHAGSVLAGGDREREYRTTTRFWDVVEGVDGASLSLRTLAAITGALDALCKQSIKLVESMDRDVLHRLLGIEQFDPDDPEQTVRNSKTFRVFQLQTQAERAHRDGTWSWSGDPEEWSRLRWCNLLNQGCAFSLLGATNIARMVLYDAMGLLLDAPPPRKKTFWATWPRSGDTRSLLLRECIQTLHPDLVSPEAILARIPEPPEPTTPEGDWLLARLLDLELAVSPRMNRDLFLRHALPGRFTRSSSLLPRTETPVSSQMAAAFGFALEGQVTRALGMLDKGISDSLRPAFSKEGMGETNLFVAERTLVDIVRRMRLWDIGLGTSEAPFQLTNLSDQLRLRAFERLSGQPVRGGMPSLQTARSPHEPADPTSPSAGLHGSWQTVKLVEQRERSDILMWIDGVRSVLENRRDLSPTQLSAADARLLLDHWEMGVAGLSNPSTRTDGELALRWAELAQTQTQARFEVCLRYDALSGGLTDDALLQELAELLGRRRAAELALEQGDLLTLKLPQCANRMYQRATNWFEQVGDPFGELIARVFAVLANGPATPTRDDFLPKLEQTWEGVRIALSGSEILLEWEPLSKLVTDRFDEEIVTESMFAYWHPLVIRVLICLTHAEGRTLNVRLQQFVLDRFGRQVEDDLVAPVDLLQWVTLDPNTKRSRRSEAVLHVHSQYDPLVPQSGYSGELEFQARLSLPDSSPARSIIGTLDENQEYATMVESLDADSLFDSLQDWASSQPQPEVRIEVRSGLHGPCWERFFQPLGSKIRVRRYTEGRSSRRLEDRSGGSVQIGSVCVDEFSTGIASRGWHRLGSPGRLDFLSTIGGSMRVLHLMGNLEKTSQGIVTFRQVRTPYSLGNSSDWPQANAWAVASVCPDMQLCVLQGSPVRSTPNRSSEDRENSRRARIFAAELFAAGVPAVMVLPSLPPELATEMLEVLVDTLFRPIRDGSADLMDCIERMRRICREGSPPLENALAEAIDDFCLYCVADWEGVARAN